MTRRESQQPDWGDTAWEAPAPAQREPQWNEESSHRLAREKRTRSLAPESRVVPIRRKAVYPREAGREMTTGPKERTRVADPNDRTQLAMAAELQVDAQPARRAGPPPPPKEAFADSQVKAAPAVKSAPPRAHRESARSERPAEPIQRASESLAKWFRPDTGAQPTFLGSDPSEQSSIAQWLGIEDELTDDDHSMLPPVIEGRLERAQRRAEQGRAVQMEIELQEAVRAARAMKIRLPASRLRDIEVPCYRMAAQNCLIRAKDSAREADVVATQNSILSARHYAAMANAVIDTKTVRKILKKANARAYSMHFTNAKKHAALGNLPLTRMSVALARTCLAAAIENGARRRSFDALEGLKVQARLNAIRNGQRLATG
ncbi:MAG: hypothetical protein AAFQ82_24130 [Myxococcota bacterium]